MSNILPIKVNLISKFSDKLKRKDAVIYEWQKRLMGVGLLLVLIVVGLNVVDIKIKQVVTNIDIETTKIEKEISKKKVLVTDVNYIRNLIPDLSNIIESQEKLVLIRDKVQKLMMPGMELVAFNYSDDKALSFQFKASNYDVFRQFADVLETQKEFDKLKMTFNRSPEGDFQLIFN